MKARIEQVFDRDPAEGALLGAVVDVSEGEFSQPLVDLQDKGVRDRLDDAEPGEAAAGGNETHVSLLDLW